MGALRAPTETLVLRREPLQRLKDHPEARLVVVQGPAGFGKTSLLRQYCDFRATQGDAIAWVRMDTRSADPSQFLRLLCEAIRGLDKSARAPQKKIAARPPPLEELARALSQLHSRAVIVVDNFEQAAAPALEAVFSQAVRLLPDGVQLCIGTRVLPTSKLSRMLVEDQIIVIDHEDLRFTPGETVEFFRDFSALSAAEVEEIHHRTDGWPAALQCFRLCMRRGRKYRSVAYSGKGITPELIDFLASEVFEDLSPQLQSLLLELCVPEKISFALVEHITGSKGGRERINEIEKAGLFLTHADLDRNWYRFHNLFRHFLLARLRTETSAEEMQRRHARIAEWYAAHGSREEAIQHYIDAGELESAAGLLNEVIDGFVAEERLGLIERYVDQFPAETLLRYESLANAAIIAYGFRRSFDKANRLVEQRRKFLDAAGANQHMLGVHNYARLFVLAAQDRIEELGAAALETSRQLSEKDGFKFAITFNARSVWLVANNQFDEARGLLLRGRPLNDKDRHLFGQAYQEAIYSTVFSQQGRVSDAIKGLSAALRRTEEEASGSVTAGSVIAAYLAEGCYEQNRIADAEALIHDYVQLAEQQSIVDPLAVMFLTQARIAHLRGDEAEAEEILERVLYLGYRHSFERLVSYARAEFVRQATLSGDLDKAERRLREFDPDHDRTVNESMVFHAGETEARSITQARYLIYTGRHANARALLQTQIREARLQRRRRRELKLTLLLAISLNAEGKTSVARRTFLEALELGKPQEFIRAFLDERQPALRLMKEVRQSMNQLPDLPERDVLVAYLDRLLRESGEMPHTTSFEQQGAGVRTLSPGLLESLTEREKNLLRHVAKGLSNKDLADRLSVSTNTIKWHLRNIFEKLQISNRVQAISIARHLGLID
jgi:LuxR family maltose regulon positive regulatory protein